MLSDLIIPPWVKPALCAVALVGSFGAGWTVNGWRWESKQAEALQRAQKRFQDQLDKQQRVSEQYEAERDAARAESLSRETRVREIYRNIPAPPAECEPDPRATELLRDAITKANSATGESG